MKEYYLGNSYLMPGLGSSALSFNYITLFFFLSPLSPYITSLVPVPKQSLPECAILVMMFSKSKSYLKAH